jgi:hypothetical protein
MHALPDELRKREDLATWNSCTPFVYAETVSLQPQVDVTMYSIVERPALVWSVAPCDHQVGGYAIRTP